MFLFLDVRICKTKSFLVAYWHWNWRGFPTFWFDITWKFVVYFAFELVKKRHILFFWLSIIRKPNIQLLSQISKLCMTLMSFNFFPESNLFLPTHLFLLTIDYLNQELQILFQISILRFILNDNTVTIGLDALKLMTAFYPGLIQPSTGFTSNTFSIFVLIWIDTILPWNTQNMFDVSWSK